MNFEEEQLERAQERKRKETEAAERFEKRYGERCIRTIFTNSDHVMDMSLTIQCYAGEYGSGWFKYTPFGKPTHEIMQHNETCDPSEKIRQYIMFGFPEKTPMSVVREIEHELNILALSY